ncbi:hypothetical protein NQ317_018989 [Molorchus minor]|uniref:Pseudouridine-5'-phosphatase n=1 Tax=Molorchus minor TaxID=1323400 RepID=A0ABQ9JMK5_9CUCU|nr:hypothetical protein NQ317_018989 [Molorchus minor]
MSRCSTKCTQFKKVTHVIFDMDGLLLDTEPLYTLAIQNIVSKYGKIYDWSLKTRIMGLTGVEATKMMVEQMDLPITPQELYRLAQVEYAIVMQHPKLLPDTELSYRTAISTIAQRFGKTYTPDIESKVIGTRESVSAIIAVTEMQLPIPPKEFQTEFREKANSFFEKGVPLMPGISGVELKKIVRHLHSHNIPICVATSSNMDSFNLKSRNHKEFFSLFSHIVCGGSDPDVKESKPKPDIFLVAASRFSPKVTPTNCLVFEDAPNGVTAARAANMQAIMVPDPNIPQEKRQHATLVISCLDQAPLEAFGLPALKAC